MNFLLLLCLLPFVPVLIFVSVNTLVVGETQRGKTTLVLNEDVIPTIESNSCAVFIFDPHSSMAEKAAHFSVTHGFEDRLIVDNLGWTEFVSSPGFIEKSRHPDMYRRRLENRRMAKNLMYALASSRKDSINDRPNNRKYTNLAGCAILENTLEFQLGDLPEALRPPLSKDDKEARFLQILAGMTDKKDRYELQKLAKFPITRQEDLAGGALRLIDESLDEVALQLRLQPTFDIDAFIENKGIYCLMGGDADDNAISAVFNLIELMLIQKVKNRYAQREMIGDAAGPPLAMRVYKDEAANYGLVRKPQAQALAQTIKMDRTDCLIVQVPMFGDEEIDASVKNNTPRKIWFRCASPTSRMAAEDIRSTLDPYKEHHKETTTKQKHAGTATEERVSRRLDGDGKGEGKVISLASVPIYETYEETRTIYEPVQSQDLVNEGMIQGLKRGECVINTGDEVFKHKSDDWQDPGDLEGFSKDKLDERIEQLKAWGVLKAPTDISELPPCEPKEAIPTKKARTGMGKSRS
jgi:hypothetical protein